jgi:hypothetical protein
MEETNGTSAPESKGFDTIAWVVANICAVAFSALIVVGYYKGLSCWVIFPRSTIAAYRFAIGEVAMTAACAYFYLAGREKNNFFIFGLTIPAKLLFIPAISALILATFNFWSFSLLW